MSALDHFRPDPVGPDDAGALMGHGERDGILTGECDGKTGEHGKKRANTWVRPYAAVY